jgi:hypothetical protein
MSKSGNLSLFVGAGFSKWAADLPIASELFDLQVKPFGPREAQRVRIVREAREAWFAQNPDGTSEEFIAHAFALDAKVHAAVIWYIVRRLSEPYIWQEWHAGRWRRHVLMINENRKYQRPGVARVRGFLLSFNSELSGVITPNYDLLIEYALGTRLFNYGRPGEVLSGRGAYPVSQWQNPITLQGPMAVAKLHGSVSWTSSESILMEGAGLLETLLLLPPHQKNYRLLNWHLLGMRPAIYS